MDEFVLLLIVLLASISLMQHFYSSVYSHSSLFITAIVQRVTRQSNHDVNEYCLNRGCLSAATHQLRSMDNSTYANRCLDFYHYACGGWQQSHPIQAFHFERTILGDIIDQRNADIERLLNSPVSRLSPQSWEWKVKVRV